MEKQSSPGRRQKRASNACQRCRQRKIKCSGTQPCNGCSQRAVPCIFQPEERKVLVPESYLRKLRRRAERGRGGPPTTQARRNTALDEASESEAGEEPINNDTQLSPSGRSGVSASQTQATQNEHFPTSSGLALPLSNPLVSEKSSYVRDRQGRLRFLGHSSTWSFSQRVLSLFHVNLGDQESSDLPTSFDSTSYHLDWGISQRAESPNINGLPSLDHALYLTNTVKFHICQTVHLFDEDDFMANLHTFYDNPTENACQLKMWFIQFLLVLAFGKAFLQPAMASGNPPGSEYFLRAMNMIPDTERLYREPVPGIEILCMVSLYLQCVDMRCSAYGYIGQALRIALTQGMHREMPIDRLGAEPRRRWRNLWWTVYILDRRFASMMGNPPSIRDEDITVNLPPNENSVYSAAALCLNAELSRVIAHVLNTVYCSGSGLDKIFLTCTQSVLKSMTGLASKLEASSQFKLKSPVSGTSRVAASLHLSYHQCIILTIRPLILCLLHKTLDSALSTTSGPLRTLAEPIQALLKTCIESATKTLEILIDLQANGLLEHFLPFDLESAFSSAFILTIVTAILPSTERDRITVQGRNVKDVATRILEDMIYHGSVPAQHRKAELVQLEQMVASLSNRNYPPLMSDFDIVPSYNSSMANNLGQSLMEERVPYDGWTHQTGYLPSQIDSMVRGLDIYNTADMELDSIDQWLWTDAFAG